jgi:hypothetical protein
VFESREGQEPQARALTIILPVAGAGRPHPPPTFSFRYVYVPLPQGWVAATGLTEAGILPWRGSAGPLAALFRPCDRHHGDEIGNQSYNLYLVFGRFPAELGPETRSSGSGSKNGAERTHN